MAILRTRASVGVTQHGDSAGGNSDPRESRALPSATLERRESPGQTESRASELCPEILGSTVHIFGPAPTLSTYSSIWRSEAPDIFLK